MKGICFKEPLFHKVVAGEKNQTRRIIFPKTDYTFWSQPSFEGIYADPEDVYILDKDGEMKCYADGEPKLRKLKGTYGLFEGDQFCFDNCYVKPRYQPGEIVFLKEPYFVLEPEHCSSMANRFVYKYHNTEHSKNLKKNVEQFEKWRTEELELGYDTYYWHNKLFMPEKAARYFIKIAGVTAERAHDITEADAILEGCKDRSEFETWWIKIHGFSSWGDNPWVWKIDFTLMNDKK